MAVKRTKQDLLNILPIGITLIDNDNESTPEAVGYFRGINDGTVSYNKDYGRQGRGKLIIYFNINYSETGIFAQIEEDGGTRKIYHGIIPSKEFFIDILTNIR